MRRIAPLDTPGLLHHMMIRGIERRKIFNDDEDRENFIERLSVLLPETKTPCYAWAFLPNHAHFLEKQTLRCCCSHEEIADWICGILQQEAQPTRAAFPKQV
jgi:hypothetical protein